MKNTFVVLAAVAVAAVVILSLTYFGGQAEQKTKAQDKTAAVQDVAQAPQAAAKVKFQGSRYEPHAYLISGGALTPEAERALDGFVMTKTEMPDGSLRIELKAVQSKYVDQNYTVGRGESLYFIETAWGEDAKNYDGDFGDDGAILVDSEGYIVK
jgi:hypothetical protein